LPVLVRELLTLYEHKGDGAALGRVTPYRDYLAWLAGEGRAGGRAAGAAGLGGGGEGHPGGAAGCGGAAGGGRATHGVAGGGAGAPAWSDAQYLHASGMGSLARPNERT